VQDAIPCTTLDSKCPALEHYTEVLSRAWLILGILILYVLHLGGAGMLGPDEPRYASIGRAMEHSGDLITPRLDGHPWFEKPPLIYWTVAIGNWSRLSGEWAARLPVALISIAFLIFFGSVLAREFSRPVAFLATAILATSVGWVAYSFAALPDLPMSAALGAAMLIALFEPFGMEQKLNRGWIAGALLGFAVLAKGFVPLVLFAPLFLIVRRRRLAIFGGMLIVAAPWHVLVWMRNGSAFWNDYFWKQHVARFLTPELEHVQPFWYYVPVLLAGLFPWTPLVGLLARGRLYDDVRVRLLAAWMIYGVIFFSAARNKLPGYVLPLMPALAIVLAVALDKARTKNSLMAGASTGAPFMAWWLGACASLLILLPTAGRILPEALLVGLRRSNFAFAPGGLIFLIAVAAVGWLAWSGKTELAVAGVALAAGLGIVYLKNTELPFLDRTVSVRPFWTANQKVLEGACIGPTRRMWDYGLAFYAGHELPRCEPTGETRPQVHGTEDVLSLEVPDHP
jgi:4-amino-4-deoxy-L-arabinose transferase-like glycosyltransferase